MAYDPLLQESLIFGGYDYSSAADGDTWVFAKDQWTDLTGTLSRAPNPMWGSSLAYDPDLKGVVLFGGRDSSGTFYNSTWLFNSTGWWNISSPVAPSPRMGMTLAYDPTDGYLVGFGGYQRTTGPWSADNDTWALRSSGWSKVVVNSGRAPPAEPFGASAWDGRDGYLLAFGGGGTLSSCGSVGQTWSYVGGNWTNRSNSSAPVPPSPGGSTSMGYDPANQSIIYFGGYPGGSSCGTPLGETWAYRAGTWSNLTSGVTGAPGARCCGALDYDPTEGGVLMFGGNGNPILPGRLNDTWRYEPDREVQFTSSPPVGEVGYVVSFNGTTRGLGGPFEWNWSFGDGTNLTDAGPNVSHVFHAPGLLTVEANLTDQNGTHWMAASPLVVYPALVSNPTVTPSTGDAPTSIVLRANSTAGAPPISYQWEVSDGFSSTLANVTHRIVTSGNYTVSFIALDAAGVRRSVNFTVTLNPPLALLAGVTPSVGIVPFQVNALANLSGGSAPTISTWDFGVGPSGVVHAPDANHTYGTNGTYHVAYVGVDFVGETVRANYSILALDPIVAHIGADSWEGVAPFSATLAASARGGGGQFAFSWDLGDGTSGVTGSSVNHLFETPGVYVLHLRATDRFGFQSNTSADLTVVAPLIAALNVSASTGASPFVVNFSVSIIGGYGPISTLWSFGDGGSATGNLSVSHRYAVAGSYPVVAQVTDGLGEHALASLSVKVVSPLAAALSVRPSGAFVGTPVELSVTASSGLPPYSYRWGGLPSGCMIGNVSQGSCNSTVAGSFDVWVLVRDALGEQENLTGTLTLTERPAPSPELNGSPAANPWWSSPSFLAVAAGSVVAASILALVLRRRRGPGGEPPSGAGPSIPGGEAESAPEGQAPGE